MGWALLRELTDDLIFEESVSPRDLDCGASGQQVRVRVRGISVVVSSKNPVADENRDDERLAFALLLLRRDGWMVDMDMEEESERVEMLPTAFCMYVCRVGSRFTVYVVYLL